MGRWVDLYLLVVIVDNRRFSSVVARRWVALSTMGKLQLWIFSRGAEGIMGNQDIKPSPSPKSGRFLL